MLRVIVMCAHCWVAVIGRVRVAIWMTIVGGNSIRRLDIWHNRVLVSVQQTLIQTVSHFMILLHRMIVVIKPRHLHHSNAIVVLRINIQMLAKPVAVIVDSVAVHCKSNNQKQQQDDANDWQDCGVGGRQEIVIHDRVNHDVVVTIAIRSKDPSKAGWLSSAEWDRKRRFVVVRVTPKKLKEIKLCYKF